MNYIVLYIPESRKYTWCCFRNNKEVPNDLYFCPHLYSNIVKLKYIMNCPLLQICSRIVGQSLLLSKAKWSSGHLFFEFFWLLHPSPPTMCCVELLSSTHINFSIYDHFHSPSHCHITFQALHRFFFPHSRYSINGITF